MRPIYLDNQATTRCDPRVVQAMVPHFSETYGNAASRSHRFGLEAKAAVERARGQIASLIGASPKEILITSGATESDNLAIFGVARRLGGGHLVTTTIEHRAVLDPMIQLEREGFRVTRVPVDQTGVVSASAVADAIEPDTVLVSVMAANNEVGTLQPIADIGAQCRSAGVLFHTDGAQAVGKVPINVGDMAVDLLSLSGHKIYGPKGIGALYLRRGRPLIRLAPLFHGGGQERGFRSGTLPVPLIVGLGEACALCAQDLDTDGLSTVTSLRDRLLAGLRALGGLHVNGSLDHRLPTNLNVSFDDVEAEALMMGLRDIAMSSGSACSSASLEASHVLRAMALPAGQAHAALRLGVGRFTTTDEIDTVIRRFGEAVPKLRALTPSLGGHG